MRIRTTGFLRFERLNRQRQVGLGVLTPPRPSRESSIPGGGVRTPSPTFRFVGRGAFRVVHCLTKWKCNPALSPRERVTVSASVVSDCIVKA